MKKCTDCAKCKNFMTCATIKNLKPEGTDNSFCYNKPLHKQPLPKHDLNEASWNLWLAMYKSKQPEKVLSKWLIKFANWCEKPKMLLPSSIEFTFKKNEFINALQNTIKELKTDSVFHKRLKNVRKTTSNS